MCCNVLRGKRRMLRVEPSSTVEPTTALIRPLTPPQEHHKPANSATRPLARSHTDSACLALATLALYFSLSVRTFDAISDLCIKPTTQFSTLLSEFLTPRRSSQVSQARRLGCNRFSPRRSHSVGNRNCVRVRLLGGLLIVQLVVGAIALW